MLYINIMCMYHLTIGRAGSTAYIPRYSAVETSLIRLSPVVPTGHAVRLWGPQDPYKADKITAKGTYFGGGSY